jgi:hypothetical protein
MSRLDTQTTSVADAEAAIANLTAKRDALVERGRQLDQVRASYAFAAHARNDETARRKLDQVHRETAEHGSELASIDAALKTAQQRLEAAQRHEARQADREQALLLREALASFVAAGKGCDAALELLVSASTDLRNGIAVMNRLGCSHPSHAQLDALGSLALRSAIMQTLWVRDIERVGPLEKKTFSGLVAAWATQVERHISSRLGDEQPTTIEAA